VSYSHKFVPFNSIIAPQLELEAKSDPLELCCEVLEGLDPGSFNPLDWIEPEQLERMKQGRDLGQFALGLWLWLGLRGRRG